MNLFLSQAASDVLQYLRLSLKGNKVNKDLWEEDPHPIPILLIHGFLGTRGVMFGLEQRLKAEGYTVFSINLGMVNINDIRKSAFTIHRKVEEILFNFERVEKIDIIGHSMGGLIGLYYVKKLGGHERVRKLIAMGTPFHGTWVAWLGVVLMGILAPSTWQMVPDSFFLQELHAGKLPNDVEIYSLIARGDLICPPSQSILDGARLTKVSHGHTALVLSDEVFEKVTQILVL